MNFGSTVGDINFTVPSNSDMTISGSGDFISNVPVHTIGGTGATTISGSKTTIKNNSSAMVELGGSTVTLSGSITKLAGNDVHILPLSKDKNNFGVFGQGEVKWAPYNQDYTSDGACTKPFVFKKVSVVFNSGTTTASASIESDLSYNYMIAGWGALPQAVARVCVLKSSGVWSVYMSFPNAVANRTTVEVHVLGIHKNFSKDNR
jgi:hypothetical protein